MPNTLDDIHRQLKQWGFDQYAEDLLVLLSKPVLFPYKNPITFDDRRAAVKLQTLLYQLLRHFPDLQPKVRLSRRGSTVIVTITDKKKCPTRSEPATSGSEA